MIRCRIAKTSSGSVAPREMTKWLRISAHELESDERADALSWVLEANERDDVAWSVHVWL